MWISHVEINGGFAVLEAWDFGFTKEVAFIFMSKRERHARRPSRSQQSRMGWGGATPAKSVHVTCFVAEV